MKNSISFSAILFVSLAIGQTARADFIIYDNNAGGAAGIDSSVPSDPDIGVIVADDVTLFSTTTASGIQWTGSYGLTNTAPVEDDFTISIISDVAGSPNGGATLASFNIGNAVNRVDSGSDFGGVFDIYEYSAEIDFTFDAGTRYWVSIVGNTTATDLDDDFYWGMLQGAGDSFGSGNNGVTWSVSTNDRQDFRLTAVPEPGLTFVLSLFALVTVKRRHT